jgi:thioredoxin:protein disulfide reductase
MIRTGWIRLLGALPLVWGALTLFPVAHAEEFLDPEVAFKFSARALDANTLEARWQIADGYYMYRDKFKFEVDRRHPRRAALPAGKIKDDEFFGKVETYRKDVRIALPIQRTPGATSVTLTAVSQGCADAGLCYTPQTESVSIKLPAPPAAAPAAAPAPTPAPFGSALDGLRSLAGDVAMPKLLPPDEAFLVSAAMPDAQTVRFDFTLTPDTYLYRDKLAFVVKSPADVTVAGVDLPAGEVKEDPHSAAPRCTTRILPPAWPCRARLPRANSWCWRRPGRAATKRSVSAIRRSAATSADCRGVRRGHAAAMQSAPAEPASESDTSRIERVLRAAASGR